MQRMTIEQLRAARDTGDVGGVSLEGLGEAIRKAHQAAPYAEWLAAEIQEAIDDPRSSAPHDDVMAKMDARIAGQKAAGAKRA